MPYKIPIVEKNNYHSFISVLVGAIIISMLITVNYYICKISNLYNDKDIYDDDRYFEIELQNNQRENNI